jgi:hypothetical protein
MAITAPHFCSLASLMAASAVATVGSPPAQWYVTDAMPASFRRAASGAEKRSEAPATISAGASAQPSSSVSSLTSAGTRAAVPQPNTTRAAVANSKGATAGEDIASAEARAEASRVLSGAATREGLGAEGTQGARDGGRGNADAGGGHAHRARGAV